MPVPPAIVFGIEAKGNFGEAARPLDRAKLLAEIEALRPQITAYCLRLEEIEADFRRDFVALLTSQQRQKYEVNRTRSMQRGVEEQKNSLSVADRDINRECERSLNSVYWLVTVTPKLVWLTKEFQLDASQQASTRALLSIRRNAAIALLDGTTHPSLRLSRVAQMVTRLHGKTPKE